MDLARPTIPFPYIAWGKEPQRYPAPGVEITFCDHQCRRLLTLDALVDTGTVGTSLPVGMMHHFGIAEEGCVRASGRTVAGDHAAVVKPRRQLDVVGELAVPGAPGEFFRFVLEDIYFYPNLPGPVLGRNFLDHFALTVLEPANHIFLDPLPSVERVSRE